MEQKRLLEAQVETLGRQVTALQEQRDAQERELRRLHASRTGASPSDGSDSATPATTPAHSVPPASGNRSVVRTPFRDPVLVHSIRILIAPPSLFCLPFLLPVLFPFLPSPAPAKAEPHSHPLYRLSRLCCFSPVALAREALSAHSAAPRVRDGSRGAARRGG